MQLQTKIWTVKDFANECQTLAKLRIEIFRDFPYLYDGSLEYEANYLQNYQHKDAIVVAIYDESLPDIPLIGAATGSPMDLYASEFATPFIAQGYDINEIFYCGESVLKKAYRGQGVGHVFFDEREKKAKQLNKKWICFCSVIRQNDHPLKPNNYQPLDEFWHKRGYNRFDGMTAKFTWKDIDDKESTEKTLQFWIKRL